MLLGIAFGLFVVAPSMLRGGLSWAPHVSDVCVYFGIHSPPPLLQQCSALSLYDHSHGVTLKEILSQYSSLFNGILLRDRMAPLWSCLAAGFRKCR